MTTIKNELIGTWRLLSYIEVPIEGDDSLFPMGKQPFGILMYSADGYMSVQVSKNDRLLYQSNDKMMATQEEMYSSLQGYIAFTGTYTVDNNQGTVIYDIESSLFPNWKNKRQCRKVDFEGDILYLKSTAPILSNGVYVNSYMTWQRWGRRGAEKLLDEELLGAMRFDN